MRMFLKIVVPQIIQVIRPWLSIERTMVTWGIPMTLETPVSLFHRDSSVSSWSPQKWAAKNLRTNHQTGLSQKILLIKLVIGRSRQPQPQPSVRPPGDQIPMRSVHVDVDFSQWIDRNRCGKNMEKQGKTDGFWSQWIGLRENLQETIDSPMKYGAFL